jgi:hypothetical protein
MSLVHPFPIPSVEIKDWMIVFSGLGFGIFIVFELIRQSLRLLDYFNQNFKKRSTAHLYTLSNFWLILSGVIHVF